MFNLNEKIALVTGATGGIGRVLVKTLVKQGARVAITGRNQEILDQIEKEYGNSVIHKIHSDLQDHKSVNNLVTETKKHFGRLDILLCNAGITHDQLSIRMGDQDWQKVIDVNLTATFILNKAAIKVMIKQGVGRIINMTSVIAHLGNKGQSNYAASKAGIEAMSKSLAQEVASRGITINCIAPGFIISPMTDVMNVEQTELIKQRIPMNKFGTSQDVANATVFIASDESSYITGQTLHINGGMLMP